MRLHGARNDAQSRAVAATGRRASPCHGSAGGAAERRPHGDQERLSFRRGDALLPASHYPEPWHPRIYPRERVSYPVILKHYCLFISFLFYFFKRDAHGVPEIQTAARHSRVLSRRRSILGPKLAQIHTHTTRGCGQSLPLLCVFAVRWPQLARRFRNISTAQSDAVAAGSHQLRLSVDGVQPTSVGSP